MLARRNRGSAQIDPPCRDRESSSTDSRKAPTRFGPFLCGHPPTIQFCLMPYTRRCLTEPGRDRAIGPRTRGPPRRLARERTAGRTLPGRAKGWMMGCCNRRGGNPSRGPPQILYASARRVAADADRTVFPICPYHRPSDLVRTFDHHFVGYRIPDRSDGPPLWSNIGRSGLSSCASLPSASLQQRPPALGDF